MLPSNRNFRWGGSIFLREITKNTIIYVWKAEKL